MSKHFCCCIPVRLGVLILSFLSLLGSAAVSFGLWWTIVWGPNHGIQWESGMRTGFIIAGVVYALFAIIAALGFFGAICRNRVFVKIFSFFLWIQLVISLGVGIFFGIALFKNSLQATLIDQCIKRSTELQSSLSSSVNTSVNYAGINLNQATPQEIHDACTSIFKQSRIGFIVSYVVSFLITLYCCIIAHRYGTQLTEERDAKSSHHQMGNTSHAAYSSGASSGGYYPHAPLNNLEAGQGQTYSYPYSKPEHGFGSTNH